MLKHAGTSVRELFQESIFDQPRSDVGVTIRIRIFRSGLVPSSCAGFPSGDFRQTP